MGVENSTQRSLYVKKIPIAHGLFCRNFWEAIAFGNPKVTACAPKSKSAISLATYSKIGTERHFGRRAQREFISPIATDDALRKSLTVAMQRENSEAAESKYWDQTFFSAMSKGNTFVYGREAIRLYSEDPMSGFFMRSPKSFLATELKLDYKNVFLKIVEKILGNIKELAERQFNRSFKGVVLGRPVNWFRAPLGPLRQRHARLTANRSAASAPDGGARCAAR